MLCSRALSPWSLGHKGKGGLEALQGMRSAAERAASPGWPQTACGPPLWPWERRLLCALGHCSGGLQTGKRVCPRLEDPYLQVKAISDMK